MPQGKNNKLSALLLGPVDQALAHFIQAQPFKLDSKEKIGVAYSGGADSTALLLVCAKTWPDQVIALHIHHGLQAAADLFLAHGQEQCQRFGIPFQAQKVNAHPTTGESPEDAARKSRYCALAQMGKELGLKAIALAQHADDQVETLLLALSRGAGLPGLSSMPTYFTRNSQQFIRPLLTISKAQIRETLSKHNVNWIEDPTNQDRNYTRNRIRLEILPHLEHNFPHYRNTFNRSIRHIAQAQALLEEISQQDLNSVGTPPSITRLQQLTTNRQSNVLRYWLKTMHQTTPSTKQLIELLKQLNSCRTRAHHIELKVGKGLVKRNGEYLNYQIKAA